MPGGVIRSGKTRPDDDAHTGFWLGVTAEGIAKFSIGGPRVGSSGTASICTSAGRLKPSSGMYWPNWLAFYGADGEPVGYMMGHDAWGHQIDIATPRQDATGDPGMITLECDGDFDALVRLRLYTERGAGGAGAYIDMQIGNGNTVLKLEGTEGNASDSRRRELCRSYRRHARRDQASWRCQIRTSRSRSHPARSAAKRHADWRRCAVERNYLGACASYYCRDVG